MIETIDGEERVIVPTHLLSEQGGDHYVLLVVGDSMTGEGVIDGDFLICRRTDYAEDGEAAVVLIGDESSVKFFYHVGTNWVRLESMSDPDETRLYRADEVKVKGVAVGLMRKIAKRATE